MPSPSRRVVPPTRRAAPLPPEERRTAILRETVPLLARQGLQVTTRQIAEAAGVAEGTLFRVFADKEEIVAAAVVSALKPDGLLAELAAVDRGLPLDERVHAVVVLLQARMRDLAALVTAMHRSRPPGEWHLLGPGGRGAPPPRPDLSVVDDAVADLLLADREDLTVPPRDVARLLRMLSSAGVHPAFADRPLSPDEVVSVVLDGVRRRPA